MLSRIASMTLVLLAMSMTLADDPPPPRPGPGPAAPVPPVQAIARLDTKGKLTIYQFAPFDKILKKHLVNKESKAGATVESSTLMTSVNVTEFPAAHVKAYGTDGKALAADKLAGLLVQERRVVLSVDGKLPDPLFLGLYKEGTVVLVPPAGTTLPGMGGYAMPAPASFPATAPAKEDLKDAPKKKAAPKDDNGT